MSKDSRIILQRWHGDKLHGLIGLLCSPKRQNLFVPWNKNCSLAGFFVRPVAEEVTVALFRDQCLSLNIQAFLKRTNDGGTVGDSDSWRGS